MRVRPIIFNTEMTEALLQNRKSQTRRIVKNLTYIKDWDVNYKNYGPYFEDAYGDWHETVVKCPYGQKGDRLWVKEDRKKYNKKLNLYLEIMNIRVEQLQAITEEESVKEGVMAYPAREGFRRLWESIHGINNPKAWDNNPWVWVIDFRIRRIS